MTGEEWILQFCRQNQIDWGSLPESERFKVTLLIPCSVRCFRVGVSTEIDEDDRCMECGSKEKRVLSKWERLLEAVE